MPDRRRDPAVEPRTGQRRRSPAWRAAALVWPPPRLGCSLALLALASWEATLGRFSAASRVSVGAAIATGVVAALVCGRGRQRKSSAAWACDGITALWGDLTGRGRGRAAAQVLVGVAAWTLLVAATIGWDLYSFSHELRSLPTLSRLFGDVTRHAWGRGLVFAGWLALGVYLAAGWRRPRCSGPRGVGAHPPCAGEGAEGGRAARHAAHPHSTGQP